MKTEELLLIMVALGGAYFLLNNKPTVIASVQPQAAPVPSQSPMWGFPSNSMNTQPFAGTQRSAAQDAAAIITAVGGVAKNVSDIVSAWT